MSEIPPVIPLDETISSYSPECYPKDESSQVTIMSSSIMSPSSSRNQQNNNSPKTCITASNLSGTIHSSNENISNKEIVLGSLSKNESSNIKMFMVTSPSQSNDISFDENNSLLNELTDNVNLSSLSFLQTKQRKIDHRRNKSEPVIPIINTNLEDLSSMNSYKRTTILESSSTSTTSNESAIVSSTFIEKKRKASKKFSSPSRNLKKNNETNHSSQIQEKSSSSSSTTKKKRPWYNSMDTIRLFLRSNNSFRNLRIKTDPNNQIFPIRSNLIDKDDNNLLIENENNNEIIIRRSSSNEKLSRDNIKSFLSTHPSSSSVSSNFQIVSSQIATCFGLSIASSNNTKSRTIVASASASISNAHSFTNETCFKEVPIKNQLRHSWTNEKKCRRIPSLSFTVRRAKSHHYSNRKKKHSFIKKYSTGKMKHRIVQPFQSTYRQRNEEFRKVFKDLPNDERLIVDYSCAWQKEILIQGRMYISQNYLCFYANFLKWETSLCLKFKEINALTREKTAKVIPNAIEIKTNKNEKFFFSSFATRDKTYAMLFRIWQAVLIDQPISSHQLWTMIHQSYGNDLDMTTDEEDTYNKQLMNSTSDKTTSKQTTKNQRNEKYDNVAPDSVFSKSGEKEEIDDHSSLSSRGGRQTDEDNDDDNQCLIPIGEEANTNTLIRQPISNINNEGNCLTSMEVAQEINYLSKCPCESHLATQLIDRTYSISVERLFDYLFGENDFVNAYHESRRIKDFHAVEWKINEKTGKRERICTYKVSVAAVFGATTICSNEKQVIHCELSKSHYIVDTEVRNEGIKYADAFFVASRYCLVQLGPNKSHLKVTCEVRYLKSLMIIIKSFIEKNAMAALQDSYTDLIKRIEVECSNRQRSSQALINNQQDEANQSMQISRKKHSHKQHTTKLNSTMNDSLPNQQRKQIIHDEIIPHNQSPNLVLSSPTPCLSSSRWSNTNLFIPFCIIIMLILLSVNIFLWLKLNEIDRMTDHLAQNYPLWSNGYSYPKEDHQWSLLLKRQEEYYQTKLNGLRSVLILTHNALKNVTDALNELTKVNSRTNSNAPIDHLHSS